MKKFITSILILFSVIPSFDIFGQLRSPYIYQISYVIGNGEHIFWDDNNNPDSLTGFIVYRFSKFNPQNLPVYDSIGSAKAQISNNGYYDYKINQQPDTSVKFYAVEAYGKGNKSTNNIDNRPWIDAPNNVLLKGKFDSCINKIVLNWNRFYGWNNNSSKYYYCWFKTGNSPYIQIRFQGDKNVPNNDTTIALPPDKMTSNFQINPDSDYYLYVQATNLNGDGICNSNVIYIKKTNYHAPSYIIADGTSVPDNNHIVLNFTVDSISQMHKYYIKRSNNNYLFTNIDSIDTIGWHIKYIDNLSQTSKNASNTQYFYKLAALNNCKQQIVAESNVESNIVLRVYTDQNMNRISWTSYKKFLGNYHWDINRSVGTSALKFFARRPSTDTIIIDMLDTLSHLLIAEQVCYNILAVEDSSSLKAISNTGCVTVNSLIAMPKFFTPNGDGKNDVFMPELTFKPPIYELIIYDRWGTKVFETTTPLGNWNGKYSNGKAAPQGVYMYYLKISGADNKIIEQKGTVVLLLP